MNKFYLETELNKSEITNVLRKIFKVRIFEKDEFVSALKKFYSCISYEYNDDRNFIDRYAGKEVFVYEWCGDYWICDDDNYVVNECYNVVKKDIFKQSPEVIVESIDEFH